LAGRGAQLDRRLRQGHAIEAQIATNGQPFDPFIRLRYADGHLQLHRQAMSGGLWATRAIVAGLFAIHWRTK
jgi:hypothetical protein